MELVKIPLGFGMSGSSDKAPYAIISNEQKKLFLAAQFHPESTSYTNGKHFFKTF